MKAILCGCAALPLALLSGCSSTPPTSTIADTASISQVDQGQKAMLLMTNSGQSCETSRFGFKNLVTGEVENMKIVQAGRRSRFSIGRPALMAVEPGSYELLSGQCDNHGFQTLNYNGIDRWFEPFEVEGGDVRFLGNLQVTAAKGEGRRGLAVAAVTRVLSLGRDTNKPVDYLVLNAVDAPRAAKSALNLTYPELTDRFVSAPLVSRIDAKTFRDVVSDAFSPDDAGKAPMKSDANDKVQAYLEAFDKADK